VRAHRLVLVDVLTNAFCFTLFESFTLDGGKLTLLVVGLHLLVAEDLGTTELLIGANELHFVELLFDFFFY
jgi:hypothetical protein